MPAGFPEWPGPREAEEGVKYTRNNPNSDGNVFVCQTVKHGENGSVIVIGRFENK